MGKKMIVGVSGEIGDVVKFIDKEYYAMIVKVHEDLELGYDLSGFEDNSFHVTVPGNILEYIVS